MATVAPNACIAVNEVENSIEEANNQPLPQNDFARPLTITIIDSSNPFLWDLKFASRIVDYVVQYYKNKYSKNIRWHAQEYTSAGDNDNYLYLNYQHLEEALKFESNFYIQYSKFFGFYWVVSTIPINQQQFEAAVLTIYEEYLRLYYMPYLNYELAVGISLFAIYASQTGLPDALYHAVPLIISKTRALTINNPSNPCQDLLNVYTGDSKRR